MLKENLTSALLKIQSNRNLTEEAYAELLKMPRATVRAMLEGRANLSVDAIGEIAKRLKIDPLDLLTDFHAEEAQIESLASMLQYSTDLPLENRLIIARAIREILSLMADSEEAAAMGSP